MKIKLFLILLFSFFAFLQTSFSQNEFKIDSLKRILAETKKDTSVFKILLKISELKIKTDSISAFEYSKEALKLAQTKLSKKYEVQVFQNIANNHRILEHPYISLDYLEKACSLLISLNDSAELALCYYSIGRSYYDLNQIDTSISYHYKALEIQEQGTDTLAIATSLNAIGLMYWRGGKLENSEEYYLKAIEVRRTINDLNGISIGYNNLGSLHWGLGNYTKALDYFINALKIAKEIKNERRTVLIINNIGLIYQEWGDYNKALKYHLEASKIGEKINYNFGLAYSYINIGICYRTNKEYDNSLLFLWKSLKNYKIEKRVIGVALAYRHIGETYYELKEYKKSIQYLKKSLKEAGKVNSLHHIAIAHKSLAKTYFALKEYNLSRKEAQNSYKISVEQNYKEMIKENAFIISEILKIQKDFKKSLVYFEIASSYKDSLFNEEKTKQIAEMQTKYETKEQNQQIELQESELAIQRSEIKEQEYTKKVLVVGLLSAIVIVLLIILGLFKTRKANTKINNQREILEKTNKKMRKLSQFKETLTAMIVHDLKNPLNSISNITKNPHIKESVSRMNTLIMNMLDIQKFEDSKMNILLENINLYSIVEEAFMQVKSLIEKKNIHFENQVSNNLIVKADKEKLERVLINLLHNASKYTPNNGKIKISTSDFQDNDIKLVVCNTGEGIPENQRDLIFAKFGQYKKTSASTGLGLTFCKMSMNAIKQEIGVESELNKNTSFWISLEIVENIKDSKQKTDKETSEFYLNLSFQERELLLGFSKELKKLELFEVSRIKNILSKAKESKSAEIIKWATKIDDASFAMNQELFKQLISKF